MTDKQIVEKLIEYDPVVIQEFFFVRCRPMLIYVGQYFCQQKRQVEDMIGEFYEYLSADNWHKLKIFRYTCTLNSYVTIIATRYFQAQRDRQTVSLEDNPAISRRMSEGERDIFFMDDMNKLMKKLSPFDRFLVQRILLDGNKPQDILDEVAQYLANDHSVSTQAQSKEQLAGYVYTRYNRVRCTLKRQLKAMGYER